MRVVIFGGNMESWRLSRLFAEQGAEVLLSVSAVSGRADTGEADRMEMERLLQGASVCVDATEPYVADVTRAIRAACEASAVPYRRWLTSRQKFRPVGAKSH